MELKKKLILLLCFLYSSSGIAQNPELFNNQWYLHKVIIDGQDFFPPVNSEIQNITLDMTSTDLLTIACTWGSGPISSIDNDQFELIEMGFISEDCFLQETIDFEILYFLDFYTAVGPPYNFNYLIETDANDNEILTLTNVEGVQAVYGSNELSVQDIKAHDFVLSPNPVTSNYTTIICPSDITYNLTIHDFTGKLLIRQMDIEGDHLLDVGNWTKGIYLLYFENSNGFSQVKKLVVY